MIEQNQIDFVLNHPYFVPGAALVGLLLLFVIFKFLLGSRTPKSSRSLEDAPRLSGKKKRTKKQRTLEKKGSDSPKAKKETRKPEVASLIETKKGTIENEKNDKKKDGKSKTKSKKKKTSNNQVKVETIPDTVAGDINYDAGGWTTVSSKEKREQLKREKKKLETENTTFSLDSTIDKNDSSTLAQTLYKPTPNISAIAKGIAPRFARAAGEQWQEKPTLAQSLPLQSKRPIHPATVPGTKLQSTKNSVTVNNQTWNLNQGKQLWTGEIGSTWPNTTVTTNANNLTNDLIGMSWQRGDTSNLLSIAPSVEKPVTGWPQGGSTWQPSGSPSGNGTWDVSTEDWVHVNGQNGRNAATENWTGADTQLRTRIANEKVEEWTLEPEGFPLQASRLDPNDPWNFEVVGADEGDWAAPASSWGNTNAEWTAPEPVLSKSTYVDVSSDDERITSKVTSSQSGAAVAPASLQAVVGAGPDFMNQATGQGQNKKSRRRRKKKQTSTGEPEQLSTPETETPKTEIAEPKAEIALPAAETKDQVSDISQDWTIPKASKKRKNKARKAD